MPGSRTAVRNRSRTVPLMGSYASGIRCPVHAAVMVRLAPAMRRMISTVSGSIQAPTTAGVARAVMISTVMKIQRQNAMAAAMTRCTVALAACLTAFPIRPR